MKCIILWNDKKVFAAEDRMQIILPLAVTSYVQLFLYKLPAVLSDMSEVFHSRIVEGK